ncbi:MAG TPA: c-type cytochrome [Myxococcota bacterium]|nr:c-type cytochrome [Myxococcota bacterium]
MRTLLLALLVFAAAPAWGEAPARRSGPDIVRDTCALCHGPGIGGAPRIGDARAWRKRAGSGIEALVRSASAGKGAMPPRGGMPDLDEDELRAAIAYMAGFPNGR